MAFLVKNHVAATLDPLTELKSLEALAKVADGRSTKIIIPSELQNVASLVAAVKEIASDPAAEAPAEPAPAKEG